MKNQKMTQPGSISSEQKQQAARLINDLFKELKVAKPVLPRGTDIDEMKRQYLKAFVENGIRDWDLVLKGLEFARSPDQPDSYFPVPAVFISWIKPKEHWEQARMRVAHEEQQKRLALPKPKINKEIGKQHLKQFWEKKNARREE